MVSVVHLPVVTSTPAWISTVMSRTRWPSMAIATTCFHHNCRFRRHWTTPRSVAVDFFYQAAPT